MGDAMIEEGTSPNLIAYLWFFISALQMFSFVFTMLIAIRTQKTGPLLLSFLFGFMALKTIIVAGRWSGVPIDPIETHAYNRMLAMLASILSVIIAFYLSTACSSGWPFGIGIRRPASSDASMQAEEIERELNAEISRLQKVISGMKEEE
jgi:hypothetical protein